MIDSDRQEILSRLETGSDALKDALMGLDASAARHKPTPESWSVVECLEHMVASEAALLSRLREATPRDETHEDRAREAKFQGVALNRLRRILFCRQGSTRVWSRRWPGSSKCEAKRCSLWRSSAGICGAGWRCTP